MNHTADMETLEDVKEPRSASAVVASIAVAVAALLAVVVAFIAIRAQSFLPEFATTLNVVPGADSASSGLTAPGLEAAGYETVELRVRDDLTSARWWYALSLASAYSIVVVGLVLVSLGLWRLRTQRSFARAASWSLGAYGLWVIVAVVLQKLFEVQSTTVLVDQLGLPNQPDDSSSTETWVRLPDFVISQPMLITMSIGLVLILAAVLLGRAWRMQTELDEVI